MLFGIPLTSCGSENTFACCSPGFTNSSNDNTRPTTDRVFPFGAGIGWGGDACVVEVVGEAVVVCVCNVSVLAVGVVTEFGTEFGVGAVTGEDGVVGADVVELGLNGLTGETGFVGLFIDFLQVSDVVAQGSHVGLPYGFGHVEERVWVMLPVKPVGQLRVCCWLDIWHVGGFATQVFCVVVHACHWLSGQVLMRVCVIWPL
jgi:hypothetical protein